MIRKLALLAIGFVILSGCTRVAFLGDSITTIAKPELDDTARDAYYLRSFGDKPGITIAELVPIARATLAEEHDDPINAVVLEVGTNDVGKDVTTWATDYDALLVEVTSVASVKCIVLTTVSRAADLIAPPLVVTAEDINAYLRARIAEHPEWHLVDWDAAVLEHEGYTTDAIHPSHEGAEWLAAADVAAVRECEEGATTTTTVPGTSTTTTSTTVGA